MGGQACVFYGAAQFSKDIDFLVYADSANYDGLRRTLADLQAVRIAVPPFDPAALARGHAVHFRCGVEQAKGLRMDVMTRLRNLPDFPALWARRTTLSEEAASEVHLLSVPDLVLSKKTQREKDWPVIGALVEGHFLAFHSDPTPGRLSFWFRESRSAERLTELARRYPAEAGQAVIVRSLLELATAGDLPRLRAALNAEMLEEQERDRRYWEPLKREMEAFRRAERGY
jgi:hypothetical protein